MGISSQELSNWTKPGFDNELERAENTRKLVLQVIENHPELQNLNIRVFAKGSYANNTNVRRDSDIDIAVELRNLIKLEYTNGLNFEDTGLDPYTGISVVNFKSLVLEALYSEFNSSSIDSSSNKVFRIRGSAKILDADIVPCTTYRRYLGYNQYREGIELILNQTDGKRHINYPNQHHENGVSKNLRTKKRYKSLVRILKNIRNNVLNRKDYASYMLESIVYNSPDGLLLKYNTWKEIILDLCSHSYQYLNQSEPQNASERWVEVNHYKFLFHPDQKWTREDARQFILDLYNSIS